MPTGIVHFDPLGSWIMHSLIPDLWSLLELSDISLKMGGLGPVMYQRIDGGGRVSTGFAAPPGIYTAPLHDPLWPLDDGVFSRRMQCAWTSNDSID